MKSIIHVEDGNVAFEGDIINIMRDVHLLLFDVSREMGMEFNDLLDIMKIANKEVQESLDNDTEVEPSLDILMKLNKIKGRN